MKAILLCFFLSTAVFAQTEEQVKPPNEDEIKRDKDIKNNKEKQGSQVNRFDPMRNPADSTGAGRCEKCEDFFKKHFPDFGKWMNKFPADSIKVDPNKKVEPIQK